MVKFQILNSPSVKRKSHARLSSSNRVGLCHCIHKRKAIRTCTFKISRLRALKCLSPPKSSPLLPCALSRRPCVGKRPKRRGPAPTTDTRNHNKLWALTSLRRIFLSRIKSRQIRCAWSLTCADSSLINSTKSAWWTRTYTRLLICRIMFGTFKMHRRINRRPPIWWKLEMQLNLHPCKQPISSPKWAPSPLKMAVSYLVSKLRRISQVSAVLASLSAELKQVTWSQFDSTTCAALSWLRIATKAISKRTAISKRSKPTS